jgi:NAD(P)-dependent dehydrogenase (short-subunit alcohol dehydrogenase family)
VVRETFRRDGRNALVTGTSPGIGQAVAIPRAAPVGLSGRTVERSISEG